MPADLGKRIQMMLDLRGISRKELAAQVGVTEVAIGRYISGEREPKAITVAGIAKSLGISIDELMGNDSAEGEEFEKSLRLVARNAGNLTPEQKKLLINALVGE